MSIDNFLSPDLFFDNLWIVLALYIFLVVIVTIVLFYNWHKYTGKKDFKFMLAQGVFLAGTILLGMLTIGFYLQI